MASHCSTTQNVMLPQHLVCKYELNYEYNVIYFSKEQSSLIIIWQDRNMSECFKVFYVKLYVHSLVDELKEAMFMKNLLIREENLAWIWRRDVSSKFWCASAKIPGGMLQYNFWDLLSLPPEGTPARVMNVNKCNWPARCCFSSPSAWGARRVARILLAADRPTQELDDILCLSKHRERDLQMYADVWIRSQDPRGFQDQRATASNFFCVQATSGRHLLFLPLTLFYFAFCYSFYIKISRLFSLSYISSLPIPFPIFIFPFSLLRFTDIQTCFNFTYSCYLFFLNSPPPALSFWFILYDPFPHYFICHRTQMFYRILSASIYSMYLVPSVLNPISTFVMWYSLVQPSKVSSVLTVTSFFLEICALLESLLVTDYNGHNIWAG